MEVVLRYHGVFRVSLAAGLVVHQSDAAGTNSRSIGTEDWMGEGVHFPRDLGIRDREVLYRSGLVVLSLLAASVFIRRPPFRYEVHWMGAPGDLPDGRCG